MLDSNKRYFVNVMGAVRSVLEAWAEENGMELLGQSLTLSSCEKVYELDVSHNSDLHIEQHLLGSGRSELKNGRKTIGLVCRDTNSDGTRIVIQPHVRDR